MQTLRDFMARDHLHCDGVFLGVERLVLRSDWDTAQTRFARFQALTLQHLEAEESLLFPAFESRTGLTRGHTAVMRAHEADNYTGYAETLPIMQRQLAQRLPEGAA